MASVAVPASESLHAVENLLGGRGVLRARPHSTLDWINVIRRGLPAAAIEALTKAVKVSNVELARALGIPERTLARRKREGTRCAPTALRMRDGRHRPREARAPLPHMTSARSLARPSRCS